MNRREFIKTVGVGLGSALISLNIPHAKAEGRKKQSQVEVKTFYAPDNWKRDAEEINKKIEEYKPDIVFNDERYNTIEPEEYKRLFEELRQKIRDKKITIEEAKKQIGEIVLRHPMRAEFYYYLQNHLLDPNNSFEVYPTHYNSEELLKDFFGSQRKHWYSTEIEKATQNFAEGKKEKLENLKDSLKELAELNKKDDEHSARTIRDIIAKKTKNKEKIRILIFKAPSQDNFHRILAQELSKIHGQAKVQIETQFAHEPDKRIRQIFSYDAGAYRYPYYGRKIQPLFLRKALIASILINHYSIRGISPNHASALSNYYTDKIVKKFDEAKKIFARKRKKEDPYEYSGRILETFSNLIGEKIPIEREEAIQKVREIFKNPDLEK